MKVPMEVINIIHIIPTNSGGGAEKLVNSWLLKKTYRYNEKEFCHYSITLDERMKGFLSILRLAIKSLLLINSIKRKSESRVILHAHLTYGIYATWLVSLLKPLDIILTEHNTTNRRRKLYFWPIEYIVYSRFRCFVCISEAVKESLNNWLRFQPKEKFNVVYNGIILPKVKPVSRFINNRPLRILSIGSLTRQKGYDVAINHLFSHTEFSIDYKILGEGPEMNSIISLIDGLPSNKLIRVSLMGYQEDVGSFLNSSDILLLPSRWEGFGLVVIEALSFGVPVVASNVDGVNELVENSDFFRLFHLDSRDSLWNELKYMRDMLRNDDLSLREDAIKVANKYSFENMISGYNKIYEP